MNVIIYFKDSKRIFIENVNSIFYPSSNKTVVIFYADDTDYYSRKIEYDTKNIANITINSFESED